MEMHRVIVAGSNGIVTMPLLLANSSGCGDGAAKIYADRFGFRTTMALWLVSRTISFFVVVKLLSSCSLQPGMPVSELII